ncbi:MAG: polysaccharide biosynthesis tyrosine autokinase [Prevotellaceae bacterium]|jgi:capsular exopolysaccharide synthesis family protein|nr:polysaccharide biosynthesis tyrosine autokinase [Prevotellaceae bacterium]
MENESQIARTEDFQLYDLWIKALRNWYWFVLSVLICCSAGVLYLKTTPKTYVRRATILIKDESKGGASDMYAAFEDLNLVKSKTNVNNEIEAFKSPSLMQDIVRRLHLDVSYCINEGLRILELYSQSPVTASFPDVSEQESFSFYAELLPDSIVSLSRFERNGEVLEYAPMNVNLFDSIDTPVGRVVISPSLYYSTDFHQPIKIVKSNTAGVAGQFVSRLTVSRSSKETTIIILEITDISTKRAEDLLNTLISVYNENWIKENTKVVNEASNFINERLNIIDRELGGIDDSISQYKSENLLTDVHSAASALMSESSDYSSKIFETNNQIAGAKYIRKYLDDQSKITDLLPTNSGLNDLNIASQISEYNSLLLKRNRLIENSSERNALIMDMNNSLNALKQSIMRTVDNLVVTLNLQLSALKTQEKRMTKQIAHAPKQEKHLIAVERQQRVKESLYILLLQKREENELSGAITTNNTRLINPPAGSGAPVTPNTRNILLAAFVFGLALPFGVIYLRETLNTTVRGKKDLQSLSVPLLGEIPLAGKKNKRDKTPAVQEKSRDMVNEAFRVIRTNMDFMRVKSQNMNIIMSTSFNSGSGKTFISLNLAMSFALTGKKVAIVDLDMRKAALSGYVSNPKTGASNFLSGMTSDINEIIVRGAFHPKLDIVPVGVIPPNPSELLLNENLNTLLDRLKSEYDYVFIDCTPIDVVTDAVIVSKLSGLVLFIVREGLLDRRMLPELENLYKSEKFSNMAMLLNASSQAIRYGYKRYGYYRSK